MGEMVAGIAHEVSQPLYSVVNFAKASRNVLAGEGPPNLDELRQWNDEIATAAARAGEILRRLRSFARRAEPEYTRASIHELIEEAVELVAFEARGRQVAVELKLCEAAAPVDLHRVQIQQVLVNLLRNAYEAIEQVSVEVRRVTIRTRAAGQFVEVSVADSGPGLSPDQQLRMFEPFVTTKPDGLGMGLAISKTIVEAHGGTLWATSNPGGGAVFHFTLPVATSGRTHAE
jgi:two-component system sensor kinase FixL